jgi:hypothetical protein
MFLNTCTDCHREQLIFPSQVTSWERADHGTVAHYTCWCGAAQTWDPAPAPESPLVAA